MTAGCEQGVTAGCEHGAANHDGTESSMASAPEASRAWLLIEHPGPWPREPAEAVLPAPVMRSGRADDRGADGRVAQHPGERDLGHGDAAGAGEFLHCVDDGLVQG